MEGHLQNGEVAGEEAMEVSRRRHDNKQHPIFLVVDGRPSVRDVHARSFLFFFFFRPHAFPFSCDGCRSQIAVSYQTIEILQEHGINANDLQKLQAAGYHTVESVRPTARTGTISNNNNNGTPTAALSDTPPLSFSFLGRSRTPRRGSCARSRGSPRPRSSSSRRSSSRWSPWTSRRRPTPSRTASRW